jgi:serpin B
LKKKNSHQAFSTLESELNKLKASGNVTLNFANSIWPQKDSVLLDDFLTLLKKYYGVSVTALDYINETENARNKINSWVAKGTNDKIPNLIPPGAITSLTRLVLVNAVYFNAKWKEQFKEENTKKSPFYITPSRAIDVDMMMKQVNTRYADLERLQIIELPYVGDEISMLIILPKDKDGIKALEDELSYSKLMQWDNSMNMHTVSVYLPRFKLRSNFILNDVLTSLGMRDAFDEDKADFSGITGDKSLFIGLVIHEGFIEVKEEGTEAAAATAVIVRETGMRMPKIEIFRANRPFCFLLEIIKLKAFFLWGELLVRVDFYCKTI